ncbi:MAG TPA: hypothetical protein VK071_12345 [Tissierellales bacterium]|nr:hypothetical protein [Tissierellales bacterium]
MGEIRVTQSEAESDVGSIKSIINDLEELQGIIDDMIQLLNKSEGEFVEKLKNQLQEEKNLVKKSVDMFSKFALTIGITIDSFKAQDEVLSKGMGLNAGVE